MATIKTRETTAAGVTVKGSPLSNAEIDTNFINLNNDKLESDWTGATQLTTVGTVTTGTWEANTIATDHGGTGQSTYSNGQILIGNSSNSLTKTTLTAGTGITVTNGNGSITVSTGQDVTTSGSVQFGSLGVGANASGTTGEIRATNQIVAYYSSDERLKENITNIENPIEKILQLNGVEYDWKDEYIDSRGGEDGYFTRKHDVGLIAQEVEKVLPEIVAENNEGYKAIKYERVVALLVEAVKELNKEVKELRESRS